jgi:hypothetical protein
MVLSFFPRCVDSVVSGPEAAKNLAGKCPPPDSLPFNDSRVWEKSRQLVKDRKPQPSIRRFKFDKRRQLFIRVHNETLSVAAMCVRDPGRSPVGINR